MADETTVARLRRDRSDDYEEKKKPAQQRGKRQHHPVARLYRQAKEQADEKAAKDGQIYGPP